MSEAIVLVDRLGDGLAQVTLNRPQIHNALDEQLIADVHAAFETLGGDADVRAVALTGAGRSFCAGADLGWMQRTAGYGAQENHDDAVRLARMLRAIYELPKPVIGLINGPAYGGGLGMTAVCDIAVAVRRASFTLSEVKLGLIPATISPYVVQAIGARQARRYFLTAERIDAETALRLGLVHELVDDQAALDAARDRLAAALRQGGPQAQADSKALIRAVADRPLDDAVMLDTARRIADSRAGAEGREGTNAFLEKRPPAWRAD